MERSYKVLIIYWLLWSSKSNMFKPWITSIDLCNILYTIIFKFFILRFQPYLGSLINIEQNAFTIGRLISYNTFLCYEIMHNLKHRKRGKTIAWLLNLILAKHMIISNGDILSIFWDALVSVILQLVNGMLIFVSYSFQLNGQKIGFIKPSRGLRQGDLLSPFLFLFCMEGFSYFINSSILQGIVISSRGPFISHLLFASNSYSSPELQ